MVSSTVDASIVIRAPIEQVFATLSDHEGMATWPGVKSSTVVIEGTPRNGLGAVRRISAGGVTLDEKVVRWDPPSGYDYKIIKGLPVRHLGTVSLTETPAGVRVGWHIKLSSAIPFLARIIAFQLQKGLPGALRHVASVIEQGTGMPIQRPGILA